MTLDTDGDTIYFVVKFSRPVRVIPPSPGPTIHELTLRAVTNKSCATLHPPHGLPTLVFSTNRTQPNLSGGGHTSPSTPTAAAVFVGGGVGETRAFWMNAAHNGLKTSWPTPCRSGGIRQPEVYGDEFCVYHVKPHPGSSGGEEENPVHPVDPADPAATMTAALKTEQFDGDPFSNPHAYPGLVERREEKSSEYTLLFQYVVGPGQRSKRLDFIDEWGLRTNGAAVVEAHDEAEGTGNYPYNNNNDDNRDQNGSGGGYGGGGGGGGVSSSSSSSSSANPPPPPQPRPQPNPNGPHDHTPLPSEARGKRLVNLILHRPGDEMMNAPPGSRESGSPGSLSRGGSPHFVIGNAYVIRVTSDAPGFGPTHSWHRHTPQEMGQMDQTATRFTSMKTLNIGKDFYPSVIHVQVHMSEPVEVICRWVEGEGTRAGDRMCPDIRLVMGTGNLTGNTTTGRPAYPLFPTGFLYESANERRPPDRSVLNFQYVTRRFDNVDTLRYLGRDALQVMGTASINPGPHRPPVSRTVWDGPSGALAKAMIKERRAGRPWPPKPYREWMPPASGISNGTFYGLDVLETTPVGYDDSAADDVGVYGAGSGSGPGPGAGSGGGGGGGVGGGAGMNGVGAPEAQTSVGGDGSAGGGYFVDHPAAEIPSAVVPRPAVEGVSLLLPDHDDPRALHHQVQIRISTEWILPDQTVWDKPPYA